MTSTIAGLDISSAKDQPEFLNTLIYGLPGAGKTRLAATAFDVDELNPILWIDVEGGTETFRKMYPTIQVVRVKNIHDQGGRLKKSAWEQLWDIYEALKRGEGGYVTIVVDNLSEAYELDMADVMAKRIAERPDLDPDVPGLREYGMAGSQMRRWVRHLRDLDMNVVFTAHELNQTDDNGNVRAIVPSFPGKLPYQVAGFVDQVLYLYTKQDKNEVYRNLQSQPAGKYLAKDRTDTLPLVLREPTMAKIYTLRNGGTV